MTTTEYIRLYDDDCIEIDLRPRIGVRVIRIYRGKAYKEAHGPSKALRKAVADFGDAFCSALNEETSRHRSKPAKKKRRKP